MSNISAAAESQETLDSLMNLPVEERQRLWDQLKPSRVSKVYDPYPKKRKNLAEWVHYIDFELKARTWDFWQSWNRWDFHKMPITYCFECQYPARLKPTLSPKGDLKKLECEICDLIHYDSRYD